MNKGRIVARGSPEELITRYGHGTTIVLAGAGQAGYDALQARGIVATVENGNVLVHVDDPSLVRWTLAKVASIEMPLKEIYTRRSTLEDVFLQLIGSRMKEGVLAE